MSLKHLSSIRESLVSTLREELEPFVEYLVDSEDDYLDAPTSVKLSFLIRKLEVLESKKTKLLRENSLKRRLDHILWDIERTVSGNEDFKKIERECIKLKGKLEVF